MASSMVDAATSMTSGRKAARIGVYRYINQNAQKRGVKKEGTKRAVNHHTHFMSSRASY